MKVNFYKFKDKYSEFKIIQLNVIQRPHSEVEDPRKQKQVSVRIYIIK